MHGLEHGAHVGGAIAPGDLHRHQGGLGGDAGVGAAAAGGRIVAAAGDDAGHGRAVSEGVDDGALAREVGPVDHATAEVVHLRDTGVDHRDADALAVSPGCPQPGGVGRLDEVRCRRPVVVRHRLELDGVVGGDGGDSRRLPQRVLGAGRDPRLDAVDHRKFTLDGPALLTDGGERLTGAAGQGPHDHRDGLSSGPLDTGKPHAATRQRKQHERGKKPDRDRTRPGPVLGDRHQRHRHPLPTPLGTLRVGGSPGLLHATACVAVRCFGSRGG